MPKRLYAALLATDVSFLLYWTVSAMDAGGLIRIPHDWMYAGYGDPRICAWNWSFLPVDLLFSILGLSAVAASQRGDPMWRPLALLSLAFTTTAGLMAVSYWAVLGESDQAWFLPNLVITVWPLFFVRRLVVEIARSDGHVSP